MRTCTMQVAAALAEVEALRQHMLQDAAVGEAPLHVEGAAQETQASGRQARGFACTHICNITFHIEPG